MAGGESIQLAADGPYPQRRWTAPLRAVVLVPHVLVLVLVVVVGTVVLAVAWLCALVRGELPGFAGRLLAGMLGWWGRVVAYGLFLTDRYPPFGFDVAASYPVRIGVPAPTTLNRLAVAFRLLLVLPAAVTAAAASLGLVPGGVVAWAVVSVSGELPPTLHRAFAVLVRYLLRYLGFSWMLTTRYPDGLFGDPSPQEPGPVPETKDDWAMTLPASSRRSVAVVLAVGVVLGTGIGIRTGSTRGTSSAASVALGRAFTVLQGSLARYESETDGCSGVRQALSCVTAADQLASSAFAVFSDQLRALPVAPATETAREQLQRAATQLRQVFVSLGSSSSPQGYERAVTASGLRKLLDRFDRAYQRLQGELLGT